MSVSSKRDDTAAARRVARFVMVAVVASAASSAISRCSVCAAVAGRARAAPGEANRACWPLAVSARAPANSLTCCRISRARACRMPGGSDPGSAAVNSSACWRTR